MDDDSEEEEEIKLVVPKPAPTKRSNAFSLAEDDDDIEVDEVDENEDEEDDEMDDEDAENRDRSTSLSPETSPSKSHRLEHPTSIEEADQALNRSSSSSKIESLSPTRRYGSSLGLGVPNGAGHPSFKSSPAFPSPLRQVSIPPSDVDELSETEYEASQEEKKSASTLPSLPKISSFKDVIIVGAGSSSSSSDAMNVDGPAVVNGKVEEGGSAETKAKSAAKKVPLKDLTSYEIFQRDQITSSSPPPSSIASRSDAELAKVKAAVQALSVTSLPIFDLSAPILTISSDKPMANGTGFDWSAAGMKAPVAPKAGEWTCSMCACKSPESAIKCTVCEEPRPATSASSSAPVSASSSGAGFNWAAAGMEAPAAPKADEWTCSMCSCKSPDSAKKCTVCDEPRPVSSTHSSTPSSAISPPSGVSSTGFNWAAAGMKAPESSSAGKWTCSVCMIQNDAAKNKCAACESPK